MKMFDNIELIPKNYIFSKDAPVIPPIVHLIWVGDAEQPPYIEKYIQQWQTLMPTWKIRLWKNADISEQEFPPTAVKKINSCIKGAQKADIMRYFIIYKYGGIYLDTDIIPHKSLAPLIEWGKPIILCHDLQLTWEYIQCAFFAACPNEPLFKYACNLTECAIINTPDIHMHTGPRLLGEAVSKCITDKPIQLLDYMYFYRNLIGQQGIDGYAVNIDYNNRFGSHTYAKMW